MAKTTPPPARARRSKAEVQQEFLAIQTESAAERKAANPKQLEAERSREAEILHAVESASVESVVQGVSALGLQISKALAEISEQLVEEVERLKTTREAVALERRELGRLHKLDISAASLDQLIDDHARRRNEFEGEMAAQRAEWEGEVKERERTDRELEETLKKQRQREAEDFEYRKAQERKKAQDKYDEEQRLLEKKNRERQDTLEKSWQEREARLKEQEDELARLRKDSETFESRMQKEVARAVADATKQAEARFEQQLLIAGKDHAADARVAELQIKSLEETLARQTAQIVALQKQLDEAKQQVQDIAVKAIEGASNARALSHVNQIAIEQAKTRGGQA